MMSTTSSVQVDLDSYLQRAQIFLCNKMIKQLLPIIEAEKECAVGDACLSEFFQGEHAFYLGKYKQALKHYLKAQNTPHYKLFCYRASAYISNANGEVGKALKFSQKALDVYPDDYPSLLLLAQLLHCDQQQEEEMNVRERIKSLEAHCRSQIKPSLNPWFS